MATAFTGDTRPHSSNSPSSTGQADARGPRGRAPVPHRVLVERQRALHVLLRLELGEGLAARPPPRAQHDRHPEGHHARAREELEDVALLHLRPNIVHSAATAQRRAAGRRGRTRGAARAALEPLIGARAAGDAP
jgi:hypothetical protein